MQQAKDRSALAAVDELVDLAAALEDAHHRGCLADALIALDRLEGLLRALRASTSKVFDDPKNAAIVGDVTREYLAKSELLRRTLEPANPREAN